ncbi:SMI1/KNR4 family protein [Streptomyces tritici]|uniref:SMI1/KNR4 family protein n=1 Tax=Streptomyces tritici TaxID=2054410 RepID=UPI003AF1ACAA
MSDSPQSAARPEDLELLRTRLAEGHDRAPLGWDGVRAFEAEHGIVLPEPYRTYVAEIGDGWAGGVVPLAEQPADFPTPAADRDLAAPFPLAERWAWEDDEEHDEDEWDALIDPVYDHGSIVLATDGCGLYWHLVVSGPQRGRVWCVADVGAAPFGPDFGHEGEGEPGFAQWAVHWIGE